ncbi:hypothetical protein CLOM_g9538, partial [Closterium sp. NIES-68]
MAFPPASRHHSV